MPAKPNRPAKIEPLPVYAVENYHDGLWKTVTFENVKIPAFVQCEHRDFYSLMIRIRDCSLDNGGPDLYRVRRIKYMAAHKGHHSYLVAPEANWFWDGEQVTRIRQA